jgi:hypothetical protein
VNSNALGGGGGRGSGCSLLDLDVEGSLPVLSECNWRLSKVSHPASYLSILFMISLSSSGGWGVEWAVRWMSKLNKVARRKKTGF